MIYMKSFKFLKTNKHVLYNKLKSLISELMQYNVENQEKSIEK